MKLTVRGLDNAARQNLRAHLGEVGAELARRRRDCSGCCSARC
jgi:hypothetical protein